MTLQILGADARNVTFNTRGDTVTVGMHHVADALTLSIIKGSAPLAGHTVDESDLIALMNAMRRASGLIQCGQCRMWDHQSGTSDLCSHCRRELKYADWRAEASMGEF